MVIRALVLSALALSLLASDAAAANRAPGDRSIAAPGRVLSLDLTGRHVGFAVGTTRKQCPQVQLWLTESGARVRFPWRLRGCKEGPSTGFGVPAVSVARTRLVWLSYIGGNLRDWQLWTATPTRKTPRQLRFVERDVDAPAPIVVGPGTSAGVPFAVDRELVYLGENGRALFRTTVPSPVRALAAHRQGRSGLAVAALLESGTVLGFDAQGRRRLARDFPPGAVTAIALDGRRGLVVQLGTEVRVAGRIVLLPPQARMLDFDQDRVLWAGRLGSLGASTLGGGAAFVLAHGTPARPVDGRLDEQGLAWSRGALLHWSPGSVG